MLKFPGDCKNAYFSIIQNVFYMCVCVLRLRLEREDEFWFLWLQGAQTFSRNFTQVAISHIPLKNDEFSSLGNCYNVEMMVEGSEEKRERGKMVKNTKFFFPFEQFYHALCHEIGSFIHSFCLRFHGPRLSFISLHVYAKKNQAREWRRLQKESPRISLSFGGNCVVREI